MQKGIAIVAALSFAIFGAANMTAFSSTQDAFAAQDEPEFQCVMEKKTANSICTEQTKEDCKDAAQETDRKCVSLEKAVKEFDK